MIVSFHFQIVGNPYSPKDMEIEFVLLVNGTSYAGVGWKPLNLGPICKSWPFVRDALDVTSNT